MNHSEKPETNLSESDIKILEDAKNRILNSDYYREISSCFDFIDGRIVKNTIAGTSGYILTFNNLFCIVFLEEGSLYLSIGDRDINEEHISKINSPNFGNGKNPQFKKNIPYSDEYCDIAKELKNCHDKQIEGISIGENSFNICFENNFELDAKVYRDEAGRLTLRVFWEQW